MGKNFSIRFVIWLSVVAVVVGLFVGLLFGPDERRYPPTVTKDSQIKYELKEKIKANPYGDWLDGKIVAFISEDEYIVEYCGLIGWFNKWKCETDTLKRSQMAKTEPQP